MIQLLLFLQFLALPVFAAAHQIKALHLTFHKGCQKEIEGIARELSIDLETWYIPDFPRFFFDGVTTNGNSLYNIGHQRAENIWNLHKEYFDQFDLIITSDTAPLSRIFLQNGWKKPLIIWICNRFDYCSYADLDCDFPDEEYYQLFRSATQQENVRIVAYTPFEHYYAKTKGIDTGTLTITPCGFCQSEPEDTGITIDRSKTVFLPPYHNEQNYKEFLSTLVNSYCGRYSSPQDLVNFKAIVHFPYAWSNLALFENIGLGIPYFIPSVKFFKELICSPNYFYTNAHLLLTGNLFGLSEWYQPDRSDIFIYFDSWEDLKNKLETTNFSVQRKKVRKYANHHKKEMISHWKTLLEEIL